MKSINHVGSGCDVPRARPAEAANDALEAHDDSEFTPQPDVRARSTRSRLSHVDLIVDHPRTPATLDKPNVERPSPTQLLPKGHASRVTCDTAILPALQTESSELNQILCRTT